ncbi:hypothetical protein [Streptomyces sp. BRA346]|uniref:hypothetical protein n=1 Tax=Streptomyces sp. BRA346 TaxID=2878199 RepID=UPI004062BC3B
MSARHRLPRTDGDGAFAGIVLVAANLFGLGVIVAGQGDAQLAASAAVVPDTLSAEDAPDAGPPAAKKDSGPAVPPAPPRAAQPARHDRAGSTTRPVPAGDHHHRPGQDAPPAPSTRPAAASTSATLPPRTSRDLAPPTVPVSRSQMSRVMS